MFNSNVYAKLDVLDKAADAAWLRNEAIANNIANATTPNYKRQDVTFEAELQKYVRQSSGKSLTSQMTSVDLDRIDIRTYSDSDGFSYRLDGNNVDIETENIMLAKNQIKYDALIESIKGEFTSLKTAMGK
ncbi:MAG: flagellar basal body rod protein FlgB [Eubacteriales bacterium]